MSVGGVSAAPKGEPWSRHVIDDTGDGADGTKLGDINGDGFSDVVTGWEEGGATRVYLNPGPRFTHKAWPSVTVGSTRRAEDAVFADLDGDGRLDVVSSTERHSERVFVHWAPPEGEDLLDPEGWRQEVFPATIGVTQWMFAEPLQVDGRNGVDLVIGGKFDKDVPRSRSVLGWLEAPADPRDVTAWRWHPLIEAGWVMSIVLEDMDGDGDTDVLCSDRYGPTRGVFWLENPGVEAVAAGAHWKRHPVGAESASEIMFLATGDIDGDGLRDIAVGIEVATDPAGGLGFGKRDAEEPSRNSRILWFRRLDASGSQWGGHVIRAPANTGSTKSVAIGDVDLDGRADLVVSCEHAEEGRIGLYWLRQHGDRGSPSWSAHDLAGAEGIKFDLVRLLDLDGDGDFDVLTNEENQDGVGLGVIWYENPAKGLAAPKCRGM